MKIEIGKDDPLTRQIPKGIFFARHGSLHGSLTVIAPSYQCSGLWYGMDLEGRGGRAIGQIVEINRQKLLNEYTPVDATVSFQNEYN